MSELYYLAGTVAIRTHVPLARHGCYAFYRDEVLAVLAQFVGVAKNHHWSRADNTAKVKFGTKIGLLLIPRRRNRDRPF
jgi:hypothetical protein